MCCEQVLTPTLTQSLTWPLTQQLQTRTTVGEQVLGRAKLPRRMPRPEAGRVLLCLHAVSAASGRLIIGASLYGPVASCRARRSLLASDTGRPAGWSADRLTQRLLRASAATASRVTRPCSQLAPVDGRQTAAPSWSEPRTQQSLLTRFCGVRPRLP